MPYRNSESDELIRRRRQASRRRLALAAAGCSTYLLRRPNVILCLCCGMESHNPDDVKMLYCGFCHDFHIEERSEDGDQEREAGQPADPQRQRG